MILLLERLTERLRVHGIKPWYPNSGRFDFAPGLKVLKRCWLEREDPSINSELRSVCRRLNSVDELAGHAATHIARFNPVYLVPHVHWEHELLDHCPEVWVRVLSMVGQALDDPLLTGGNAVVVEPEIRGLTQVITHLLHGLRAADVLFLSDAPVIVRVHHHGQVWWSTTDPVLLPADE